MPFNGEPLYVTRPFLPPLEEFEDALQPIWDNKVLTNNGPMVIDFSNQLTHYLQARHLSVFTNGTLGLQIGIQGLRLSGEVITSPFTFVATTHALYWNNIRPVFCDIEPKFFTIDPTKIEQLITPWTTAILAVHVFGYPCQLEALADIAARHRLKLIYDAAHAFGVTYNGMSIAGFGDLSMFSFHATKLFHSIEGGCLTYKDGGFKEIFEYLRNFGFKNEFEVVMPGTNAKMNEFQAVMGMITLRYIDSIIAQRAKIDALYREQLQDIPGIILPPQVPANVGYNYAYFPIQVDSEACKIDRDSLYDRLKQYNIYSRKYFYPLIQDYACYKNIACTDPLDNARKIANSVLTLPFYQGLTDDDISRVCSAIRHLCTNG